MSSRLERHLERLAEQPSELLPSDQFDKTLARLLGLPNGVDSPLASVQVTDAYGNTTSYMLKTVRTDEGTWQFITIVQADGHDRIILPPEVLKASDRQRESITATLRKRQGKRLAESRTGRPAGGFTPEMRQKALATRRARAERRAARKARRKP